jgi:triacylglycerol lipase
VNNEQELVVVLHGVALNRWFTLPLARALTRAGYRVANLNCPTRRCPWTELGDEWLPKLLSMHRAKDAPKLHFVVHSMGGLIVRRFLARTRPENLGRVVMIATPNQGSEVADRTREVSWVRAMIGLNLAHLGTGPDARWRLLPVAVDYPVGVIAGSRPLNPLGLRFLPRPHDGTVSVASTHLAGETDHVVLPSSHTGLLFRAETARQAIAFLQSGRFCEPGKGHPH